MTFPTGVIRQGVMLPASPEIVFDMLMDPVKHAQFTGSAAGGSSDVGGTFEAWDGYILIRNLELRRGVLIVQEWSTTEWPGGLPPSRLEIRLRPIGQGTDLSLTQSGVPLEDVEKYAQGWYDHYWDPLFEFLREISVRQRKREGP
jgi:uncharacterized protein YndB with AHSA1/START domain